MKKKRKTGLAPGTVKYTGRKKDLEIIVTYHEYDSNKLESQIFSHSSELIVHSSNEEIVQWYDIKGLHNEQLIDKIGRNFEMHPLAIEELVDVYKRPEFTDYENGHFFSLKAISYQNDELKVQNLSLYFSKGFLLTFQEFDDDFFIPIKERLQKKESRVRTRGADYLAYAIIDLVVDHYFTVIDALEEKIEKFEDALSLDILSFNKDELFKVKKDLLKVRRLTTPLRDALNQLEKSEAEFMEERTSFFIKNVFEHVLQITDNIDSLRDICSGIQDLYLSELSLKMNSVMQFLTIITAIFVPIAFLAGLYGMNFEFMPELHFRNGYFYLLALMAVIALFMIGYFRRKKWL